MGKRLIRTLHVEAAEDGTVGGSVRSVVDLARGLPELRVRPTVLFYQDNHLVPELTRAGIPVIVWESVRRRELAIRHHSGRIRRAADALAAILRRRRLIRSLDVDLVHLNNSPFVGFDDWLPAARMAGVPCVVSMRGDASRVPGRFARGAFRWYHHILPVSQHVAHSPATLAAGEDRVSVVYNGVDLSRMPHPLERDRIRREVLRVLDAPSDTFLAVMAGTVREWKGQIHVVNAVGLLPPRLRRRIRLLLVGGWNDDDRHYVTRIRGTIERLGLSGQVRLLGPRTDVPSLFLAADIAVHASVIPEPFGLVVVESLAVGTPVLASNRGGPKEVLAEGGGWLHDPLVPEELTGLLALLMDEPHRLESSRAAARRAAERFPIDRTRNRMVQVYRSVLSA